MPSNKKGLADLKAAFKEIQAEKARQAAVTPPVEAPRQPAELLKDSKLFDRATRTVKPIQANARVIHPPATLQKPATALQRRQRAVGTATQATPLATSTAVSDGAGLYPASGDATDGNARFAAPGVGPDTVRKLRQAYWPVGAQLDLHGMTADQARERLIHFLETSRAFGTRCVKVIHGKGYGSKSGQPVLKQLVRHWLTQIAIVQAFATPADAHGGQGALLVLIKLT